MRTFILATALLLASPASAQTISLAHTITIDGSATVYADPDHASMTLGVVTDGTTVGEALKQNNIKMDGVLSAIRALGVKQSELQTSAFSIEPQHPRVKDGGIDYNTISGYAVSNSVTVTVSDLTKVGAIIDAAANAGANTSNNVTFEISNREELLDKVRAEAMRNARHKADIMANAVGATVGPLITVGNTMVRSMAFEDAPMAPPPPPPPPPPGTSILLGQLSVSANVTAVFALK
ncbi:MAG TPA: SIMPL domain-containing protein [Rhizomicrobium sp.]|nr:SIMPL domain-containing protein [Rhizomicrobium sp.]